MRIFLASALVGLAGCAAAQSSYSPQFAPLTDRPAMHTKPRPTDAELRTLERSLRELLLKNLPDPLVKSDRGWGRQKETILRTEFHREGGRLASEPVKGLKNDGTWRRFTLRAARPEQTLALDLKDASFPEPGRAAFTAIIGVDCDLKLEQQIWKRGIRLYSGETRGRCRGAVLLKCELTSRTELKPGSYLPDFVVRVRVVEAQVSYDGLVIEHTAGLGGDAARIVGDAMIDVVKQAKPDLERDLLARANAAIVKAADTREVRVSFEAVLNGGAAVTRK
jgi:hypothetical protein